MPEIETPKIEKVALVYCFALLEVIKNNDYTVSGEVRIEIEMMLGKKFKFSNKKILVL